MKIAYVTTYDASNVHAWSGTGSKILQTLQDSGFKTETVGNLSEPASYVIKGKSAIRFATPERVQREIVSFDRHQDFAPGEYHLTPKSPSSRLGKSHRCEKRRPGGAGKTPKRKVHKSNVRVRLLEKGR